MNPFEQQMKLARDLVERNAESFRKLAEFDANNFSNYVQFNQDFASRLPEVKDIQGFVELQREYGEQLWNNAQEALKARAELQREAFEANNEIIRNAFASQAQETPVAKESAKNEEKRPAKPGADKAA